jgi:hypothetical protein
MTGNGFYRTLGALSALISMNLLVWFIGIPIETNYIFGNMAAESLLVVGLIGLLLDLGFLRNINSGTAMKYLKLGLIALIFGAVLQLFLFSSFFIVETRMAVWNVWWATSPFTIFLIGLPVLYISDRMSYKRRLLNIQTTGWRGLLTNATICFALTFVVGYFLFTWGYLAV